MRRALGGQAVEEKPISSSNWGPTDMYLDLPLFGWALRVVQFESALHNRIRVGYNRFLKGEVFNTCSAVGFYGLLCRHRLLKYEAEKLHSPEETRSLSANLGKLNTGCVFINRQ